MSRLITRLGQDELVSRARSTKSSREVVVQLTPKAKTLMKRLIPIALRLEKAATRNLSKQDLAALKRVLRQIHDNLTQQGFPTKATATATRRVTRL